MKPNNLSDSTKNQDVNKSGKGTGMSSEAGSDQSEKSWQGTGGGKDSSNTSDDDNNAHKNQGSNQHDGYTGNSSNAGSGSMSNS